MSSHSSINRRDFLSLLTHGSLALGGLVGIGILLRYLGLQDQAEVPTRFDLGPAGKHPPGSRMVIPQAPAVVVNQAGKWTAYSLVCPHLGCMVNLDVDGYACPCHGSRFDSTGNVQNGPAKQSLTRLRLETDAAGHLILFTTPAAPST